ncbi:GNAT family N-acetyltransferase [Streptomyces spectabilis]|uniref:GNAT family N-acetyltransferase n=1 Tax=Streptomyces spectabilis TaxID=68270 RepID=A0A5P2X3P7_STRST|nr:GNAT family N-acetyltransferase [Streptomyces spectabilis]MBB5106068.1 ribosomal protein S18 acetylase RimI-like enzyme [Streptomyces spectabilis]MCI3901598.1 GNAT family N-acetyltransferase [Streptomyces spectabilis]QEV59048.1 GNAT family N-acetyltransferase [Streptomyces spectabilis]GGV25796.1 N-acetyltransferase [Streptomyces spectabilis]
MTDKITPSGAQAAIRSATAADVSAVREITHAAYHYYIERIGRVPAPMESDHAQNVAAGRVHVAEADGTVVGLVVVYAYDDHLYLDNIAVHPDAKGTGLGRRLLEFVDQHARGLGLPEIRLYTNALMWENQKLYPRFGYEFVERRVEGVYDRVHYRKALAPRAP